jgi:hypothetical protein
LMAAEELDFAELLTFGTLEEGGLPARPREALSKSRAATDDAAVEGAPMEMGGGAFDRKTELKPFDRLPKGRCSVPFMPLPLFVRV